VIRDLEKFYVTNFRKLMISKSFREKRQKFANWRKFPLVMFLQLMYINCCWLLQNYFFIFVIQKRDFFIRNITLNIGKC